MSGLTRQLRVTAALLALCGGAIASAETQIINGVIDSSDPTMPVVFISDPDCTGQGVTPVLYDVYAFTVGQTGVYSFLLNSTGDFASLYLFSPTFDPMNGFPTCIAGANDNPPVFDEALTPGVQYYVVPFDDTFDQFGGDYQLTITGPGSIFVGNETDLEIPTLSPIGIIALVALLSGAAFLAIRRRRAAS